METESQRRRMDAIYRLERHVYDATRWLFLIGRDAVIERLQPPPGGAVLELGCGTARNLIAAARRYPDCRLFGLDVSPAMLSTAQRSVLRARLDERIVLVEGDAAAPGHAARFGIPAFDRIFISYALSMIPPWREAVEAAWAALAPGGELHIVDFGQQERWPYASRQALHRWLARYAVEPRANFDEVLLRYRGTAGASVQIIRLFGDYARLAVLAKPRSRQ